MFEAKSTPTSSDPAVILFAAMFISAPSPSAKPFHPAVFVIVPLEPVEATFEAVFAYLTVNAVGVAVTS